MTCVPVGCPYFYIDRTNGSKYRHTNDEHDLRLNKIDGYTEIRGMKGIVPQSGVNPCVSAFPDAQRKDIKSALQRGFRVFTSTRWIIASKYVDDL